MRAVIDTNVLVSALIRRQEVSGQVAEPLLRVCWKKSGSRRLVAENDLIVIEGLSLGFMNRNGHQPLSSHDAGFGLFRQRLEYKIEPLFESSGRWPG